MDVYLLYTRVGDNRPVLCEVHATNQGALGEARVKAKGAGARLQAPVEAMHSAMPGSTAPGRVVGYRVGDETFTVRRMVVLGAEDAPPEEKPRRRRLTAEERNARDARIEALYRAGVLVPQIAEMTEVSIQRVGQILTERKVPRTRA